MPRLWSQKKYVNCITYVNCPCVKLGSWLEQKTTLVFLFVLFFQIYNFKIYMHQFLNYLHSISTYRAPTLCQHSSRHCTHTSGNKRKKVPAYIPGEVDKQLMSTHRNQCDKIRRLEQKDQQGNEKERNTRGHFGWGGQGGLSEEMTSELRSDGWEGASHSRRRDTKHTGSETGESLACSTEKSHCWTCTKIMLFLSNENVALET